MKNKPIELDVDFIGGQAPLTKEEERKISEYLKTKKLLKEKKYNRKTSMKKATKTVA